MDKQNKIKDIIILIAILFITACMCGFITITSFFMYIGLWPINIDEVVNQSYQNQDKPSIEFSEPSKYSRNYFDPESDKESYDYIEDFPTNFEISMELNNENEHTVYLKYFIMANTQAESERLEAIFNYTFKQKIKITVIDDQEKYEELMGFNFQDELGVAGLTGVGEIILLTNGKRDDYSLTELYAVIGHELVHAYHFDAVNGSLYLVPRWFSEGTANYFASYPNYQAWVEYEGSGDYPDLTSIDDSFTSGDMTMTVQGYAKSAQFINYLVANWGMDNVINILLPANPYSNFYTNFNQVFGDSPENLYQTWNATQNTGREGTDLE